MDLLRNSGTRHADARQVGQYLLKDEIGATYMALYVDSAFLDDIMKVAQAYSSAVLGADFVIPYYNCLERAGVDAGERIAEMAELLHSQSLPTRILAASIHSPDASVH